MFTINRRFIAAVVVLGACSLAGASCSSSNSPGVGSGGAAAGSGGSAGTGGSSGNGSPSDAGDAGPASDLTKPGPYAVGHVNYVPVDSARNGRTVPVSVWYPVDASAIPSVTTPAQYPLDPVYNQLQVSTSTDWEALGYDPAYEALSASGNRPFPLVILSPGSGCDGWQYLYIGTRLASHGYVVAAIEHANEGQWPGIPYYSVAAQMFYRTRDVPFVITELLLKNDTIGEPLYGVIDSSKIAMSGHSLGGYTSYALAGGDDNICDALSLTTYNGDLAPEPLYTCVPAAPDPRIRAIVLLDGASQFVRFEELARISVPSLIIGETPEHTVAYQPNPNADPNLDAWIARPHAAIHRGDSYRVDVTIANHMSFAILCDAFDLLSRLGANLSAMGLTTSTWPCAVQDTFDPKNNPATRQIVTTYMLAFLNTYLGREDDAWMLTSDYAVQNQPLVEFFDSEECDAPIPIDAASPSSDCYTYQPHPGECLTAQKDPPGYFAP